MTVLGAFMRTEFLCISVLRVASGPRVKLISCKNALTLPPTPKSSAPPPPPPTKWFIPLTVLRRWSRTHWCFVVHSTRRFVVSLALCYFVFVFFSPFSIAITSLGEERVSLSAFRMFVRLAFVWFCLFPLPLGVWEEVRLVNVALPGLFSYLLGDC